ncbi:sigma 54-interacting transcriptional regulator [Paenalkalicoccus suaedae]|uniref:Sigma 54-interacting transcriptional regulator n=1 Tax=Paenalkalicoccus suaedae TaxID=2592382 RepID=A0A859FAZ7_9BACI|nr:sigma 54-interacting transcriptional regulator [Paenalkalicoccus suaedae]QKS70177.1 sigma 54-interacting transcriptional regulator [Paenalkalicoccus suaedae]
MKGKGELPVLPDVYKQLLDAVDVGVHVVDLEGRSIIYNKKMSEIEDMDKEDVLYKSIMEIFLFQSEEESRLLQALKHGANQKNTKQTYFNFKGQEITTVNDTFPLLDAGKRIGAVEIARDITKLEKLTREQTREKHSLFTFDQIVGESPSLLEVIERAKLATRTTSSVLIYGETGTGKELFAQSIHTGSERATGPFISQNCAALPDSLIEGMLFGSVKGAFTGATNHPGLFEQANGGTLMLDELNSLSAPLQAKLLRAIQEKSIRRIGDTKDRAIDVRIIATMNEDPMTAIAENRLREDLYYRLSVVSLVIPPLRERRDDILRLAFSFIMKFNKRFMLQVRGLSKEVAELFAHYDFPGNVRELEHVIEGAMNVMYDDEEIEYSHLPTHMRTKFPKPDQLVQVEYSTPISAIQPLHHVMEEMERTYVKKSLESFQGNITKTAEALGLSRQNLQYRVRKFNLR